MNLKKTVSCLLAAALLSGSPAVSTGTAISASPKQTVRSMKLLIDSKNVTKKTLQMETGGKASLTVRTNPAAAAKTASFKSGSPGAVRISSKGQITAIRSGTARITVTVSGKYKKKTTWMKVSVKDKNDSAASQTPDTTGKNESNATESPEQITAYVNENTLVHDVMKDPALKDYGRLLFPVDQTISSSLTLGQVENILTWYHHVDPAATVEIVNTLMTRAAGGETVFYDIYTDEEKQEDPDKENTGLFFFRGTPGAKFAVLNAGGGFAYVGAMHDSFPAALELGKKGYNAFALIYRSNSQKTACEDLARAISVIFERAGELRVDTSDYSLWGGSAGARMAAVLGADGPAAHGGKNLPRPAAVITQYTGYSTVRKTEPPTYACVGTNDGIADYRTMQRRIDRIRAQGTDAEIEVFEGLPHGFGLGTGTNAQGWTDHAVSFWEAHMKMANPKHNSL